MRVTILSSDQNLIEIGYIKKAHGIKGEVLLKLHDGESDFIEKGLKLFLDTDPYIIKSLRGHNEGLILFLEGVDSRNKSDLIKGRKVYIYNNLKELSKNKDEVYLVSLLNYKVELNGEVKGVISGFSKTEAHDLVKVSNEAGKTVEIPWVDQFISSVKDDDKIVTLDCPEELFDYEFFQGAKK